MILYKIYLGTFYYLGNIIAQLFAEVQRQGAMNLFLAEVKLYLELSDGLLSLIYEIAFNKSILSKASVSQISANNPNNENTIII